MRQLTHLLFYGFFVLYLGLYKGNLAIMEDSRPEPVQVFPYCQELFPTQDQEALRQGIPFSNREELSRLMEDFLS